MVVEIIVNSWASEGGSFAYNEISGKHTRNAKLSKPIQTFDWSELASDYSWKRRGVVSFDNYCHC